MKTNTALQLLLTACSTSVCAIMTLGGAGSALAFTASDATDAWNHFNDAFYVGNNGNAYYLAIHGGSKSSFWQQAEEIEMACDRGFRTGSSSDKAIVTALCNGFENDFGTDWTAYTSFNDDVMWACLAHARAYLLTGNSSFASLAADNFNYVYNGGGHRASPQYDSALGGGMWWSTDHSSTGSKNACVNGPGALAAHHLYKIYGSSTGFYGQGQNMFNWEKSHLYQSNGSVWDHENANGTFNQAVFTYNQGTFLGAAYYYGDNTSANAAANYVMNSMCDGNGILPQYGASGDGGGFNGIFARWLVFYMYSTGQTATWSTWLYNNANQAWSIRNANLLSWCDWESQTPASGNYSFSCSDTVVIMNQLDPQ